MIAPLPFRQFPDTHEGMALMSCQFAWRKCCAEHYWWRGQQGAEDLPLGIGQVGLVEGPRLGGRGPGRTRWLGGWGQGATVETGVGVEESQQPLPTSLRAESSPKIPMFPNPL